MSVIRAIGWFGKRKSTPCIQSRTVVGLMTRGAVMNESCYTFIGYQVRIKLAGICSYPAVMVTPVLTIQLPFA